MTIIDGRNGAAGAATLFLAGSRRSNTPVAELPEQQYRRIVQAQEQSIRTLYGEGGDLSGDQTAQAQAALERLQALRLARTAFLAQQVAQENAQENIPGEAQAKLAGDTTETASAEADPGQAAIDAFRKIMDMTPEERLFELLLKKRGLTQEELDALPPEEREKIIAEIKEEIREKIEKKAASSGTTTDAQGGAVADGTQTVSQQGPSPSVGATGSAATIPQQDVMKIAEERSPTGKVGFEDLLLLMARGRDDLSRLTGEGNPDPKAGTPDSVSDDEPGAPEEKAAG
ncbi:hypothetical protein EOI86_19090 [Hwanghaeella grinnelliae]|uniref:Uncharacterized protein n=1 Tax=Hwanghaeella grinnelliae TaxID=2500179 RepID=A0A3S2VNA4_9PROT|nr:hypothetical protein [Hwanghaeella grinnelliae]RVU34940.1 hypothetical protein EOI86_19090 [Hwanghaeella grinnelliae]